MSVLELPEELVALRDAIRSFIQREVAPKEGAYAQEIQETGTFSALEQEKRALRKRSAAEGFYTLFMPESAGGGGVGYLGLVLCVEECMRHGLLLTMPGGVLPSVEGPTPILLDGTPEQQERYLAPTMRAEREACFALTEPDAGSDATRIRTRAERVDGGWVINGRKHFITHGAEADYVILFAVTDPGSVPRAAFPASWWTRTPPASRSAAASGPCTTPTRPSWCSPTAGSKTAPCSAGRATASTRP
jgi:acyl-CoA dehydrogenase